jgi:hypothetical protein
MTSPKEARAFERLVALIEHEAAPRDATVTTPDRIRDLVTGRMREVDAAIRFKVGSAEVLITVECRMRKRAADDTWIEQLATKRLRIGAAKTIAVSSTRFTRSAIESAKHHGIELRELSRVEPEHIQSWFLPHGIAHVFRRIEDVRCELRHTADSESFDVDPHEPLFKHALVHTPFPAVVFFNFIELKDPNKFWALPLDGTKKRVEFHLDARADDLIPVPLGFRRTKPNALNVRQNGVDMEIVSISLSANISYDAVLFRRDEGTHHLYTSPEGEAIQRSEFVGEVMGVPARFSHQSSPRGQATSTVEFQSGLILPSTSFSVSDQVLQRARRAAPPNIKLINRIVELYSFAGLPRQTITPRHTSRAFANSWALLDNLDRSLHFDEPHIIEALNPSAARDKKWQAALIHVPIVLPLPENIHVLRITFAGSVQTAKTNGSKGIQAWRLSRVHACKVMEEASIGRPCDKPCIVFHQDYTWELNEDEFRLCPTMLDIGLVAELV